MSRIKQAVLAIAAAIVCWQLFLPPVIGLANNGDFSKITGIFSLGGPPSEENAYAPVRYLFGPQYHWVPGFYAPETLVTAAAVGLNWIVSKDGAFDIRLMGVLHGALYLLAFCLLLPFLRTWALAILILLFADVMYVSQLNSFYMDTAALVSLALAAAFYTRGNWRWFAICAALVVLSKSQHAPLGLILACFALHRRRFAAAGLFVAATAASYFLLSPADYKPVGYYTVIFYRVLPDSKDVSRDLAELGLDDSYRRYIGTHAYIEGSPMGNARFVRELERRTGYARLGWFFLRHPASAWRTIRKHMSEAGRQRPVLGNFDRAAGMPPYAESRAWAVWSGLERALFDERGRAFTLYTLAIALALFVLSSRRHEAAYAALAAAIIVEMLVASLCDAVDIPRHYMVFHALSDIGLAAIAIPLAHGVERWS